MTSDPKADEKLIAEAEADLAKLVSPEVAKKVKALIFVIVTLMTSACVGPAPAPVSNACSTGVADIIHPSRQDTPDTLRQIDFHNKAARILCPDGR